MLANPASAAVAVMRSCFTTAQKLVSIVLPREKLTQEDALLTVRAGNVFYLIRTCTPYTKWFLTFTRSAGLREDIGLADGCQQEHEWPVRFANGLH